MSMVLLVIVLIFLITAVGLSLLPPRKAAKLFSGLSFGKKGIRKISRRHDITDSLGNGYLFIGCIFCIVYPLIPMYSIVYLIYLSVGYICLMGQNFRISVKYSAGKRLVLIWGISLVVMVGMMSALGCFNNFVCKEYVMQFVQDIFSKEIVHVLYWFKNISPMIYLMQVILFLMPLYVVASQFKYMRLENTYKAYNIVTFVIKMLFVLVVIYLLGSKGFDGLSIVYQLNAKVA